MRQLIVLLFLFLTFGIAAQTGIGTTTPNASAKLDITATDKGFLPPRVALTGTNVFTPITGTAASATGLLVYNTTTAGTVPNNVVPGYYYWNGSAWLRFINPTDNATNVTGVVAVVNGGTGVTTSTGSGSVVLSNTPSLVTPNLGFASASSLTIGDPAGTIAGDITINPTTTQNEGGQINIKKSIVGSTKDWIIDQYGTSSTNARFRIFAGNSEIEGISILENGNVGIGSNSPSVRLQVNGDIIANSIAGSSDARFKTNITPIENPLQKVLQLRGVHFDWNTKVFPERLFLDKKAIGFIAQEVEKIVPEVVQTEKTIEGYKAVQYDKLVALLVEAIKEQQKQINRLQKQVAILKKKTN